MEDQKLSLSNLGNGAAIEKFDDELEKVLNNMLDVNCKENAVRSITLKVKIMPKDREFGNVEIECISTLAPSESYATQIYFGKDSAGKIKAYEHNPEQLKLQFQKKQENRTINITNIKTKGGIND